MNLQQYCLRWKYHHSNLQTMFSQLLDRGCFCDVTLACEGQTLKAHRVVLCACSTYFDSILTNTFSDKDPIIIMKDCKFEDIKCLIEFMYKGEINVEHDQLASLLRTAEDLRIKGLAEVSWRDDEEQSPSKRRPSALLSPNSNTNSISNIPKKRNSISSINNNNNNNNNNNTNSSSNSCNNSNDQMKCNGLDAHYLAVPHAQIPSTLQHLAASPKHISAALAAAAAAAAGASPTAARTASPLSQSMHGHGDSELQQIKTPQLPHLAALSDDSPQHRQHSDSDEYQLPIKKKRGRPPLDDDFDSYSTPKITHSDYSTPTLHSDNNITVTPVISSDDISNDNLPRPNSMLEQSLEVQMDCEVDLPMHRIIPKTERPDTPPSVKNYSFYDTDYNPPSPMEDHGASAQVTLTPQEEAEWCDVIKMNDYLAKGRRPQFWEETFTKRVMEAIKTKDLEMKKAAQLLGVSYGTLYGRYRETYGCLKHPYRGPFMVSRFREFLSEQGTEDIIGRLQRGEITLPRAAELMNTSTTNLTGLD